VFFAIEALFIVTPASLLGVSRGRSPDSPAGSALTGPSKVRVVVTPPGPWTTYGRLSFGSSQHYLFSPIFLGAFWTHDQTNVTRISRFGKKWFDIRGFTNFTVVHFVVKCHIVNFSQKSHFCRLHLR